MSAVVKGLRWTGAVVLLVIAALLVGASLVARFAKAELLDTDAYVATVAPLATEPDVQNAVTDRVTTAVMSKIDVPALVERIAASLNTSLDIQGAGDVASLASPAITDWVTNEVHGIVHDFITSPQFPQLWTRINQIAHQQVADLLTGTNSGLVTTSGTDVVVDLGPVLDAVKERLISRGFGLAAKIPSTSIPYQVGHVENLPRIQQAVHRFTALATWLPIIALILLGLAVWLAPGHRRGLLIGLVAVLVVLVAMLAAARYARTQVVGRSANQAAGAAVYDIVTGVLLAAIRTVAVAVILGLVWTVLAGGSRLAIAFRRTVNRLLDIVGEAIGPREPLRRFVTRWHTALAVVLAFGLLWWLLARPSITTAVLAATVGALLTATMTLIVRLPRPAPVAPAG